MQAFSMAGEPREGYQAMSSTSGQANHVQTFCHNYNWIGATPALQASSGRDMGSCMHCGRPLEPHGLQKGHLSPSAPPGPLLRATSSTRWQSQQPRWRATRPRRLQRRSAAMEVSTDAPAAAVAVPVITPTDSALDCDDKPYTCHSWRWRGHNINYAVPLRRSAGCSARRPSA
jgi:hypothetical protein